MGYENAPATRLLATSCACCGRPLVDAVSVETGVGPDCRRKYGYGEAQGSPDWTNAMTTLDGVVPVAEVNPTMTPREASNRLVYRYAIEAEAGNRDLARLLAGAVAALGFETLAAKLIERLCGRVEISETTEEGRALYAVRTPYREDFGGLLRAERIGARWDRARKVWLVPTDSRARAGLWRVLRATFPGALLVSDTKGTTTVPEAA